MIPSPSTPEGTTPAPYPLDRTSTPVDQHTGIMDVWELTPPPPRQRQQVAGGVRTQPLPPEKSWQRRAAHEHRDSTGPSWTPALEPSSET